MNKKKLVDRVAELLARFRAEVENLNSLSLYDINIHSENVIIPILNKVYGLNLVNANVEEKNNSAIDLIDKENRIAIQVTSTASGEKVKHTLEQYLKYKKYLEFDTLIIYVITSKQKSYSESSFSKIINKEFIFNCTEHIYDYENILNEINSWISIPKIQEVTELFEFEFSDEKINNRKYFLENKDKIISETLYPNIIEVQLPEKVYIGTIGVNRDEIITKSWETEYKLKKRASDWSVINKSFEFLEIPFVRDWIAFEKKIISFKKLDDKNEPLNKLVEDGTVEEYDVNEFASISFKYEIALAQLIDNSIQELLSYKDIQWLRRERMFRFKPPKLVSERKVTWKNKKTATRTVVKEVWNSEHKQIIYFQQLSFKVQTFRSENTWFVSITPTWSYTYNGYSNHKSESNLITQKKKLETNNAVYQHFMFISYCFMNKLKESEKDYSLLSFREPFKLTLSFKENYGN
jgi:phage terminase large subunit-like protein